MKTPYAFTYVHDYGESLEVTPTLAKMAAWFKGNGSTPASWVWEASKGIDVHFDDGTRESTNLHDYIEKVEVNRAEVETHIDDLRAKSKESWAKWWKEHPGACITGSCPIHDCDREELILREIEARSYRWKETV